MNKKIIAGELEKIAKDVFASDNSYWADEFGGNIVHYFGEMIDMLDETGEKYNEMNEKAGQLDAKLRRLFEKAPESERKVMAYEIIKYFKMHKISMTDTISSTLYDTLSKYGNVKFEGRKPKYSIVVNRN